MQGKVVLITGAARGIGAETAKRLAGLGAKVVLVGLEGEELRAVAASCGPDAPAIEADITDLAAMESAMASAAERFGRIDVVFQNAGIGSAGMLSQITSEAFERTIEVNVLGTYRVARAAIPHLERSGGYLLVNASIAALASLPGFGAYATSKHATEAIANTLRMELAHRGIGVGCCYFTWIDTTMVSGAEEHRAFRTVREAMRPPLTKTYPVSVAVDSVVRGIERRSRIVVAPWWVRGMLVLRSAVPRLAEPDLIKVAPQVEREFDAEVAEHGPDEVFQPVGPGGAAAVR